MQDRYRRIDEILLRRTAGPYIGSKTEKLDLRHLMSAYDLITDLIGGVSGVRLCQWATSPLSRSHERD
jgi:hypothetical protein